MKKLFTLIALFLMGWMWSTANEASITFSEKGYANSEKLTTVEINDDVTLTFSKGTGGTDPAYYNTGTAARLYGGNTLTISAPGFDISQITFTCASGYGMGDAFTANVGELSGEPTSRVWTGSADEVVIKNTASSGHARIITIVVAYAPLGADVVAKPTFSPAAGAVKAGTEVTISCATADATIQYSLDNETWTAYTAPIAINDDMTIYAKGVKGTVVSDIAQASYTILPEVPDLTALSDAQTGDQFIMDTDLLVVYTRQSYTYVYDGTSYALIYQYNLGATVGQVIKAGWVGQMDIYNGLPEIKPQGTLEFENSDQTMPQPIVVDGENVADVLTATNVNRWVLLKFVTFETETPGASASGDARAFTGMMEDQEIKFWNPWKLEGVEAGTYNVEGFIAVNNGNVQVYPAEYLPALETIQDLNCLSDIENGTMVEVGMPLTYVCGTYVVDIVYDGTTYGGLLNYGDTELNPGDVVAPGWIAGVYDEALEANDDLVVDGTAELPPPARIGGDDVAQSQKQFNYIQLVKVAVDEEIYSWDMAAVKVLSENGEDATVYLLNVMDEVYDAAGDEVPISEGLYDMVGFWVKEDQSEPMALKAGKKIKKIAKEAGEEPEYYFVLVSYAEADMTPVIEDLNTLSDIPDNTQVRVGMPLTVVKPTDMFCIVYDGTMYGGVQLNQEVVAGDVIAAGWTAYVMGGALIAAGEVEVAEGGDIPALREVEAAEVTQNISQFNYMKLMNVYLPDEIEEYGAGMAAVMGEDTQVAIAIMSMLDEPLVEGTYNLTGFWVSIESMAMAEVDDDFGQDTPEYVFIITAAQDVNGPTVIDNLNCLVDFEDNTEVVVDMPLVVVYFDEAFGTIVWDANGHMYGAVGIEQEVAPGDVLAAGWTAVYVGGALVPAGEVEVTTGGTVPETAEVDAEDIAQNIYAFNYVTIQNVVLEEEIDGYFFGNANVVSLNSDAETEIWLYNNAEEPFAAGNYDITGFWYELGAMLMDYDDDEEYDIPQWVFVICNAVVKEEPKPAEIYLRGGMNNWGVEDAWKFNTEDGVVYTLEKVTIMAGVEFKVADANWGEVDFGGVENMVPDTDYTLVYKGSNCSLADDLEEGTITFNLETKVIRITKKAVGITAIEAVAEGEYYNLQGVKVANPKAGNVYIRVIDGKASKVVVK